MRRQTRENMQVLSFTCAMIMVIATCIVVLVRWQQRSLAETVYPKQINRLSEEVIQLRMARRAYYDRKNKTARANRVGPSSKEHEISTLHDGLEWLGLHLAECNTDLDECQGFMSELAGGGR